MVSKPESETKKSRVQDKTKRFNSIRCSFAIVDISPRSGSYLSFCFFGSSFLICIKTNCHCRRIKESNSPPTSIKMLHKQPMLSSALLTKRNCPKARWFAVHWRLRRKCLRYLTQSQMAIANWSWTFWKAEQRWMGETRMETRHLLLLLQAEARSSSTCFFLGARQWTQVLPLSPGNPAHCINIRFNFWSKHGGHHPAFSSGRCGSSEDCRDTSWGGSGCRLSAECWRNTATYRCPQRIQCHQPDVARARCQGLIPCANRDKKLLPLNLSIPPSPGEYAG